MDRCVKRMVLGVFCLNLLQLILYPPLWDWGRIDPKHYRVWNTSRVADFEDITIDFSLKRWPSISSFKPWTNETEPYSCEAYFGHGFTDEHWFLKSLPDLAPEKRPRSREDWHFSDEMERGSRRLGRLGREAREEGGSFQCLHSETLRTSICRGTHLVMDLDKISLSRGGEVLEEVIGRDEDAELPVFSKGAFQVQVARDQNLKAGALLLNDATLEKIMPKGQIRTHTLRALLASLQTVYAGNVHCAERVVEPTVIVTRFEYANLFHTATDWYSAYISSRVATLPFRPHLVLLDGHCKSPMDDGWKAMFSSVKYAMHFSGPVCFDHAIFAPLGYDIPLFKYIGSSLGCSGPSTEDLEHTKVGKEQRTARLWEFGEFFAMSFESMGKNVTTVKSGPYFGGQTCNIKVLFVRREDYLAHPRHNGRPESRLSNEEEVFHELQNWALEKSTKECNVTIVNGVLAHMKLEEQIQAVREADVLVGAHGAGLTHLLFSRPTTIVLELSSPDYRRPHFETLSYWMGLDYRVITMDSSFANTGEVRRKMNEIFEDIKGREGWKGS